METFAGGFALLVGISNYRSSDIKDLGSTIRHDVNSVATTLRNPDWCAYPQEQITCLLDEEATTDAIRDAFGALKQTINETSTLIVYFSGHGARVRLNENQNEFRNYLVCYDSDIHKIENTAISGEEFADWINDLNAGRVLVILDCCHAGGVGQIAYMKGNPDGQIKDGLDVKLYERLGRGKGRAILSSSLPNEYSWIVSGYENSLFTHFVLKGLQGAALPTDDSLIKLTDLFKYVVQNVRSVRPDQNPLLKATLQDDFPIALWKGGSKHHKTLVQAEIEKVDMQSLPKIDCASNVDLDAAEINAIQYLFDGYAKVFFIDEFGGGFSGSRVFHARPFPNSNQSPEMSCVVKIGTIDMILKEVNSFERYVKNRIPNSASLTYGTNLLRHSRLAAIRYPLARSNSRSEVTSLHQYIQKTPVDQLKYVLIHQIFDSLNDLWADNQMTYDATFRASFDRVLPTNLEIEIDPQGEKKSKHLTPATIVEQDIYLGDEVSLKGFSVTRINSKSRIVYIDIPRTEQNDGRAHEGFRIRCKLEYIPKELKTGQVLKTIISGTVTETRHSFLIKQIKARNLAVLDVSEDHIVIEGVGSLINPLKQLNQLLDHARSYRVGTIHGDLNLENILVGDDQDSSRIFLIDFADSRRDYLLHDLLRLETGIWLYIVPSLLQDLRLNEAHILELCTSLHHGHHQSAKLSKVFELIQEVRRRAGTYLHNPDSFDEYYQGLILYLLGSLKFENLDLGEFPIEPKRVALVAAATHASILEGQMIPISTTVLRSRKTDSESQEEKLLKDIDDLIRELRILLRRLELFTAEDRNTNVRRIAEQPESLKPFLGLMPGARTATSLATTIVAYFKKLRTKDGESALIIFLKELSVELEENSQEKAQLDSIINQLLQHET